MNKRRLAIAVSGVVLGVAGYWLLDRWWGPFAAARVYEAPEHSVWRAVISLGHWLWYAALIAASLGAGAAIAFWPGRGKTIAGEKHAWRWVAALAVFAAAAVLLIRAGALGGAPLFDDEMIYRFQAQTITMGRLTADPPPDAERFKHIFLGVWKGRWFGQYSFGHPALLALGELLGRPGVVGAAETALMVLLLFLLADRLFDRRAALLTAFLAAVSPFLLCTGATLLSQNSATPLVLLGILFTLRAAEHGRFGDTLVAALALGGAFWCRQMEPAVFAFGPLVLLAIRLIRGRRRLPILAGGLLGSLLAIGPLLLLQRYLWGDAFWTNYQAYWWGVQKLRITSPFGFGLAPLANHTPAKGLLYTLRNWVHLDVFLLGLPGATILAAVGFAAHRKQSEAVAVFAGVVLSFVMLFFYFWPSLADTGPQLYHTAGAVLLPFVAAGLIRWLDSAKVPALAAATILLVAGATFWPVQLQALHRASQGATELQRLVAARDIHHAIVFARARPWPTGYAVSPVNSLPAPRPDFSDDVLFARTGGTPVNRAFAEKHFPDRALYYLQFIDGKIALLPLDEYTGRQSLLEAAVPRDISK